VRQFRDDQGDTWTEQSDGSFRQVDPEGGYWEEPSIDSLRLYYGPLTTLEETS
jgi:hypothetical protein